MCLFNVHFHIEWEPLYIVTLHDMQCFSLLNIGYWCCKCWKSIQSSVSHPSLVEVITRDRWRRLLSLIGDRTGFARPSPLWCREIGVFASFCLTILASPVANDISDKSSEFFVPFKSAKLFIVIHHLLSSASTAGSYHSHDVRHDRSALLCTRLREIHSHLSGSSSHEILNVRRRKWRNIHGNRAIHAYHLRSQRGSDNTRPCSSSGVRQWEMNLHHVSRPNVQSWLCCRFEETDEC